MNIISLVCANARVQGIYIKEQYKRALTSLLRENSRGTKGGLEGWSSDGRLEVHATAALLWAAKGEIHTLRAPRPGHENPGESVKLPRRVWYNAKWRAKDEYECQVQKTGGLEHK